MTNVVSSSLRALAAAGLFPKDPEETRRQVLNGERYLLDTSNLRDLLFTIRPAAVSDISDLLELEVETWSDELRATNETIRRRITGGTSGAESFVAVDKLGKVFAVIYTQRIASVDRLVAEGSCHANQEDPIAIVPDGAVLQLISVSSSASKTHLQAGSVLRFFVLLLATADSSISLVAAMTRCSQFEGESDEDYIRYVFGSREDEPLRHTDPTLAFHLSAGAKIFKAVPNYRPADKANLGYAVNVRYSIRVPASDVAFSRFDGGKLIGVEEIRRIVSTILPISANIPIDISDIPFMELGLDSLMLIELGLEIKMSIGGGKFSNLSSTFLFDYPTPRILCSFLNNSEDTVSFSAPIQQDNGFLGVVGMACNFPNAASPDVFFHNLCAKLDSVRKVPDKWISSDSDSVRFAAFLEDKHSQYFDPSFYGLSDVEASTMDPHHRIILDLCFDALMSAQLLVPVGSQSILDRVSLFEPVIKNIGVFVGFSNTDFIWSQAVSQLQSPSLSHTGVNFAMSSAANRVSHIFGLTGPSMVIDTACSSSISALYAASMSLQSGQCDAALVASADLLISKHSLEV
jgi:polyketide synthase PksN